MEHKKIYDRQFACVYRVCKLYLHNIHDAEDAVQSIFLKAFEKEVSFTDEEHEKAWFITVAKNYCKDQLKSRWFSRRVEYSRVPEASYEEEFYDRGLYEEIMQLPEKYREVIYLYYYEDYSIRELAALLGRKQSTLQTQLAVGRKKLKVLLKDQEEMEVVR